MIYIILGMHKSGTTLIAQTLHESEINMGEFDKNISYDMGNKYERVEAQKINRKILSSHNKNSLDTISHNNLLNDNEIKSLINSFTNNLNKKYINWGFKDPRTTIAFPVWSQYIHNYKLIGIYRNPIEVWSHYQKNIPSRKFILKFIKGVKTLRAWHIYNKQMLNTLTESSNSTILFEYSSFLTSENDFSKLKDFTEIPLIDLRDPTLRRSNKSITISYKLSKLVCKIFLRIDIDKLLKKLNDIKI